MGREPLLPPETLARYADAIVRTSLGLGKGDTLVVQGEPEHRQLLGAMAEYAYRRFRETASPHGALAAIAGDGEAGYLDGVPPQRIATDYSRIAKQLGFLRRAQLNRGRRWR